MLNRIIRMAAVACTLSILAGCTARLDPAEEGVISFTAGTPLLRDGASKGVSIIEGNSFADGNQISVFGWHSEGLGDKWIFNNEPVRFYATSNQWTYGPPLKQWEWQNAETDYYDFLAVYPYASRSFNTTAGAQTTLSFTFNTRTEQVDMMVAGKRRLGNESNPKAKVPLSFSHQLSAVRVMVYNESSSRAFTLNSVYYKSLLVSGTLGVTMDGSNPDPETGWSNMARNNSDNLFGGTGINETIPAQNSSNPFIYPTQNKWDLVLPQSLSDHPLSYTPSLVLGYTIDDTPQPLVYIPLKTVEREGSNPSSGITSWEAGQKYTYKIYITLDGGVRVNVITTEWEDVYAETPGIML